MKNWHPSIRFTVAAIAANVGLLCGNAQTGTNRDLAFEAASVKQSEDESCMTRMNGGPGSSDPGRVTFTCINMTNLLSLAYNAEYDSIIGPGWLQEARFDVVATLPPGATKEDLRLMLLHLLQDRFKLVAHRETREMPGFALVVAKNGPVLKRANEDSVPGASSELVEQDQSGQRKLDEDGFPVMPGGPGVQERCIRGGCRFKATSASMRELADTLPCRCPIADETNLTGKYAFVLTCDVDPLIRLGLLNDQAPAVDHEGSFPDVFHALQTQLGLKLERKKVPTSLVRIDHIEKVPGEN